MLKNTLSKVHHIFNRPSYRRSCTRSYRHLSVVSALRFLLLSLTFFSINAYAAEVTKEQIKGLDEQVQDIKKDVLQLTSELTLLEEKLLFPSNTQVSLFVSLQGDKDFVLDSMQIKLDNKNSTRLKNQNLYLNFQPLHNLCYYMPVRSQL